MSRILFIRVKAETYDEKEVPQAWPRLYVAVWPDKDVEEIESPAKLARKLVPAAHRGVLELADAFVEYLRFGELAAPLKHALKPAADALAALRHELDEALGNRDAQKASLLCTSIEESLDSAEEILRDS